MQDDQWHLTPDTSVSANLHFPCRRHRCIAGLNVIDRDNVTLLISQNDVGPDAAVQSVARETFWIETLLDARRSNAWKVASPHCPRKLRMNDDAIEAR
jgi:hypothetical protein